LWTPFLIFGGSIVWMYYTLAHKPGGQPIGALERVFAKLSKFVGRLVRRRRREAAAAA
jgi:lipopolysaccharide export system permease protein